MDILMESHNDDYLGCCNGFDDEQVNWAPTADAFEAQNAAARADAESYNTSPVEPNGPKKNVIDIEGNGSGFNLNKVLFYGGLAALGYMLLTK